MQRITRTSGTKQVQRTLYLDAFGHVVRNVDPNTSKNGRDWRYVYDAAGHLVGTSDARGCGKNIFYDGLGRVLAEDYSPCEAHHAPYTAPDVDYGTGTEAFYRYDSYEVGQLNPTPGFQDEERFALGRLTSLQDRGAHTRFNYDNRGRVRRTSRRVAKPGVPESTLGTRFGSQWFESESNFDLGDRLVEQTTGVSAPELLVNGRSAFSMTYDVQSQLMAVTSSYGALLRTATYEADGQPTRLTYGDLASTKVDHTYDDRRRLKSIAATRTAPGLWTTSPAPQGYTLPTGANTTQTSLLNLQMTLDAVSNPTLVADSATASQWPNGSKPVTRTIGYDSLYRVTSVGYSYASSNLQVHPFDKERIAGDRAPVPLRTSTSMTRVGTQTIAYDGLGNITQSTDDLSLNFDRSLGTATFDASRPDQMTAATGTAIVYDEAGNMVDVRVSRATGNCSSYCAQQYRYDWDEVGQLQRARRWDYARTVPSTNPAYPGLPPGSAIADMSYAYSGGQRVLKGSSVGGAQAKYSLEVLGTLRLNGALYDAGTQSYERNRFTETAYMAGFARLEYDTTLPQARTGTVGVGQHVYLSIGDHLGSTSVVIDSGTSEVVEKATFMSHGAIESDYRPTRWQGFREEYKFTGKEEDIEVGLTYFGARYYHARLQRFASPDPLTVHGVAGDLNPYAYVSGRTMNHVDPWGLDGTYVFPDEEIKGSRGGEDNAEARASSAAQRGQASGESRAAPSIPAKVAEQVLGHTVPFRVKRIVEAAGQDPKAADVAKGFLKERVKNPYKLLAEVAPHTKPLLAVVEAGLERVAPEGANGGTPGEKLGKEIESAQLFYVTTLMAAAGDPVAETPKAVAPGLKAGPRNLQAEAIAARDRLAAEAAGQKHPPATVVGAYSESTGKVTAGASRGGGAGCAEGVCDANLGSPGDTKFTTAVRPRTGQTVPVCNNCESTYGRGAFPPNAAFKSDQVRK